MVGKAGLIVGLAVTLSGCLTAVTGAMSGDAHLPTPGGVGCPHCGTVAPRQRGTLVVGLTDEFTHLPGASWGRHDINWDDTGRLQLFLPGDFSVAARYGLIWWLPEFDYSEPMDRLILHSPSITGRWHMSLTEQLSLSPGLALTYLVGWVGDPGEYNDEGASGWDMKQQIAIAVLSPGVTLSYAPSTWFAVSVGAGMQLAWARNGKRYCDSTAWQDDSDEDRMELSDSGLGWNACRYQEYRQRYTEIDWPVWVELRFGTWIAGSLWFGWPTPTRNNFERATMGGFGLVIETDALARAWAMDDSDN